MINEFVEKIMVHAPDRSTGERIQEIEIYLKFIGKFDVPMPEPTPEELAAEEKRRQKRIRDHEKYLRQKERKKKIAEGQIVPGEPYAMVCQCCGETFHSIRPNAKFCTSACRQRFYRQQTPSAPTPSSVRPPAASGFTASKSGSFRRRMQYPARNRWKPIKPHNTEHSGLPDEGRPLFLCPNMEVLF